MCGWLWLVYVFSLITLMLLGNERRTTEFLLQHWVHRHTPQCYVIHALPVLCIFLSTEHNYGFRNFWASIVTNAHYEWNDVMLCFAETGNSKSWTESRRPVIFWVSLQKCLGRPCRCHKYPVLWNRSTENWLYSDWKTHQVGACTWWNQLSYQIL